MAKRHTYRKPEPVSLSYLQDLILDIDPDCGYWDWLMVLMAVFHATQGSDEGFELVDDWSYQGMKYPGTDKVRYKWDSFDLDHPKPVTVAMLVWLSKKYKNGEK